VGAVIDPAAIDRAARALWERDARRSIGLASSSAVWPVVAPEYRKQAEVALTAAAEEE
jgi:hypothetical protein